MTEISNHWFFQDARLSEKPFKSRTFVEKIRVIRFFCIMGVIGGFIILLQGKLQRYRSERESVKRKLKHFKPTVHEGIFVNTISWEERDVPLTDEQLKNRY